MNDSKITGKWSKGDIIGQEYEVYGLLGKGGFGIVYLVYSRRNGSVYALKTFRDEYLNDLQVRQHFQKEASIWINLDYHPNLVRAFFVKEFSGRLYIALEYVKPNRLGLNSLEGYLMRQPPQTLQSLEWAIAFCHGMEYAYSKGLKAHRDIKPANILITVDQTIKITDFGLAGVFKTKKLGPKVNIYNDQIGLSLSAVSGACGTPTHMAPEQFVNVEHCDERSDLYSFGVVLFQMASRGALPFVAPFPKNLLEKENIKFWQEMQHLHETAPAPALNSPLSTIIQRCLEKEPARRYQTFMELRLDLEDLYARVGGKKIRPLISWEMDAEAWNDKGISLKALGRNNEAIACYEKAISLQPQLVVAWGNKGVALHELGLPEEALQCFDIALGIDEKRGFLWNNKGICLESMGRYEEAIFCYQHALLLDQRDSFAWCNKGNSLMALKKMEEAMQSFDAALNLDPDYATAWNSKGVCLKKLGHFEEAMKCFDRAVEIDPFFREGWCNRGLCLQEMGKYDEALECYDRILIFDPKHSPTWNNRGYCLNCMGRTDEAIKALNKSVELDPDNSYAWHNLGKCFMNLGELNRALDIFNRATCLNKRQKESWNSKGICLHRLNRAEEAISCYRIALELDPYDWGAFFNKALAEDSAGWWKEAADSYKKFLDLNPSQCEAQIAYAQRRLKALKTR
ncbi:MAG: tetratricopeptide repeat protein [Anaerolineae bacterium]|nr:tetratricopeptide repeat protein [Anaerolineae bacterium]